MSCPTCGHTLARVCTQAETVDHFHCERCGTMVAKYLIGDHVNIYTPKLVERCRELEKCLIVAEQPEGIEALRILGISESINVPADRPK